MKNNWGETIVNLLLGLPILYAIHRWILPEIASGSTSQFILGMEKLVLTLIARAFLFGEVHKYARQSKKSGVELRDVAVLLAAIAGSGVIVIGLTALAGPTAAGYSWFYK